MSSWNTEQVLALAPDASSAKSGKDLASPRKWVLLGQKEETLWGLCQGSGAKPYQVCIDLGEPAFKCSCPSRKFPCKHGLGLFLIFVGQSSAVPAGEIPDWAQEWLKGRAQRAEKKAAKVEETKEKPPDPEAQAKRAAEREGKVRRGLEELDLWLRDLVRQGLVKAQVQPGSFWENTAARMVDAQAPGIARRVREMSGIPGSGEGWPERLLEQSTRLHLLCEGFERLAELPPELQTELRVQIGWTQSQQELMARTGVQDEWLVLSHEVYEEERLRVQRNWLRGKSSGRQALVLSFSHLSQRAEVGLMAGTHFKGELVFFDSTYPLRALMKKRDGATGGLSGIGGYATLKEALEAYGHALAVNPWVDEFPTALAGVKPVRNGAFWSLIDGENNSIPIAPKFPFAWELLAISGGVEIELFGEWNGDVFLPLSAVSEGRFVNLQRRTWAATA